MFPLHLCHTVLRAVNPKDKSCAYHLVQGRGLGEETIGAWSVASPNSQAGKSMSLRKENWKSLFWSSPSRKKAQAWFSSSSFSQGLLRHCRPLHLDSEHLSAYIAITRDAEQLANSSPIIPMHFPEKGTEGQKRLQR